MWQMFSNMYIFSCIGRLYIYPYRKNTIICHKAEVSEGEVESGRWNVESVKLKSVIMIINNQTIKQYTPMVRTIARQFTKNPIEMKDLMQEGYIGLIEAAKRYDPDAGVKFDSYASWWVRKYIREYIIRHGQTVSLPFKTRDYHRSATLDMDRPLYQEENGPVRFADLLTDGKTPETERIRQEEHQRLNEAIDKLSARERQIICKIYGIGQKKVPQKQIAQQLGITPMTVWRIQETAPKKMKKMLV